MASKLKKIAKTQIFGKSTNLLCPPNCEKKSLNFYLASSHVQAANGVFAFNSMSLLKFATNLLERNVLFDYLMSKLGSMN